MWRSRTTTHHDRVATACSFSALRCASVLILLVVLLPLCSLMKLLRSQYLIPRIGVWKSFFIGSAVQWISLMLYGGLTLPLWTRAMPLRADHR